MKDMTIEQLMERRAAIATEVDLPEADLDALMEEARAINEELERRKAEAAKRTSIRAAVAKKDGEKIVEKETKKSMTIDEIRALPEYTDAYARYVRTEDPRECRKLLTENGAENAAEGDGILPVPTVFEGFIRTNWERNEILRRCRRTSVRGNIKVGFELSATPAEIHEEGLSAPAEEELQIGTVTIIPKSIKKWIRVSDEMEDMGGEEFLRYLADEITDKIAKGIQEQIIKAIVVAPGTANPTEVSANIINNSGDDLLSIVAQAMSLLSAEANNVVVIMNRQTWGAFKAAQAAANYAYDPFEGLPVLFDNNLFPLTNNTQGAWLIVGDLYQGVLLNYPNGDDIRIKRDDLSLAELDLVKYVGRSYVGVGLVADKMFTVVSAHDDSDNNH